MGTGGNTTILCSYNRIESHRIGRALVVVVVDGRDEVRVGGAIGELVDWAVLEDEHLHLEHVLGLHPVPGGEDRREGVFSYESCRMDRIVESRFSGQRFTVKPLDFVCG